MHMPIVWTTNDSGVRQAPRTCDDATALRVALQLRSFLKHINLGNVLVGAHPSQATISPDRACKAFRRYGHYALCIKARRKEKRAQAGSWSPHRHAGKKRPEQLRSKSATLHRLLV